MTDKVTGWLSPKESPLLCILLKSLSLSFIWILILWTRSIQRSSSSAFLGKTGEGTGSPCRFSGVSPWCTSSTSGPPSPCWILVHCLQSEGHLRLNPPAFPCLCPGLSSILNWYSDKISSHHATWLEGSFRLHNHSREARSVRILNSLWLSFYCMLVGKSYQLSP